MTRKGRKSRGGSRRKRVQKRLFSFERGIFKAISMGLFILAFLTLIYIGLTSDIVMVVALAGIAIFLLGSVALPVDRFKQTGEYLWSGRFGEDLHSFWQSIIPGRGRGQATARTLYVMAAVVLAFCLVLSAVVPATVAAQDDGFETTQSCESEVYYDEFRSDEATIEEANQSGEAEVIKQNTRVKLNESDAFYRLTADNPNSYCVVMTVDISSEVFPAAALGEVDSLEGTTTAKWTDVTDFDSQSAYTEVRFSVPANSTVKFAPSKPTVFLPAWRDDRKRDAKGIVDKMKDYSPIGDEETLEKRTYYFNGTDYQKVTVRLDNPDSESERIDEWDAVYRLSKDDPWKPVNTDTTDPVYYSRPSDDKVRFTFNDDSAVVEFRANPDMSDGALFDVRSYWRSVNDIWSYLPMLSPPGGTGQ